MVDFPDEDLLQSTHWPVPGARARAGRMMAASTQVHTILKHLRKFRNEIQLRDVSQTLSAVTEELEKLEPDIPLSNQRATAARKALDDLLKALRNTAETSQDHVLQRLEQIVYDHNALIKDIRYACYKFIVDVTRKRRNETTFSLILFSAMDHGGAIAKSFNDERGQWMDSLRPLSPDEPDDHLAIIPPPDAITGIKRLADRLGVVDLVPCVVFLGKDMPPALPMLNNEDDAKHLSPTGEFIQRFACHRLEKHPDGYPAQLKEIYRTVYTPGALWPGTQLAAGTEKLIRRVIRINLWAVMKLYTGALWGKGAADVVESAQKLIEPPKK